MIFGEPSFCSTNDVWVVSVNQALLITFLVGDWLAVDVYQRELTFVTVVVIILPSEWWMGERGPGSDFVEVGLVVWFSSVTWMLDNVHAEQVQDKSTPMLSLYVCWDIPWHLMWNHWSHASQLTAACLLLTALPHDPHGYLGIWVPGLISMSNISSTVEPLTNDHPHQRPSLSYDHISCDGQWFLFVYESLTSDHPSYTTTPMWFWGWSYKRGSTVLWKDMHVCDWWSVFLVWTVPWQGPIWNGYHVLHQRPERSNDCILCRWTGELHYLFHKLASWFRFKVWHITIFGSWDMPLRCKR